MKETQDKLRNKRKIEIQKNMSNEQRKMLLQDKEGIQGITLVALVVTIIVLLILAGITINMLLGENGIIRIAQEAKNTWENAIINEQESLNSLLDELNDELRDKSKDIYVFLYDDGTLAFSNKNEKIEGKTLVKEYGNIVGQEYTTSWVDGVEISNTPWSEDRDNILKVSFLDEIKPTSTAAWFTRCEKLTQIEGITNLNTSNVTSMRKMFIYCKGLTSLDLSSFNTRNVTDMQGMFYNCVNLTNLNVSGFDTRKVTTMHTMFGNCYNLTSLDVSSFNTSKVTDMYSMFYNCHKLTNIDVSSWDTSKVTNMDQMFGFCFEITSLDLSSFDTSKVMNMRDMFKSSNKLTVIYVGPKWVINEGASIEGMFDGCGTSSVTVKTTT